MLKLIVLLSCCLVSRHGIADSTPSTSSGTLSYISQSSSSTSNSSSVVNINTATTKQLSEALSGIGDKKARDIVAWRRQFGPFKNIHQLTEVKGIGDKTVEKNKANIRLK